MHMPRINEQQILRNLQDQNPWWVSGEVKEDLAPAFKRNEFARVRDVFFNELRRFPILSGPRRVGKSTIMFQIIDELLRHHEVQPARILFYTLDDFPNDSVSVEEAIRVYKQYVYSGEDFYIFVDEAQKDIGWKACLKKLFDLNKKTRAMISGSSSVEIDRRSEESGSARFLTIKVPTLSFFEFCEMNGKKAAIGNVDPFKMHLLPIEEQTAIYSKIATLQDEFIRYLRLGGFPEYVKSEQYGYVSELVRDQVVTKAIRQDIPKSYGIRDVDSLSALYAYFCFHSSDIVSVETISGVIGIERLTCNQFIDALEKANLIYASTQLDVGGKKLLRPRKKIYVSDYGIRCAVTRNNDIATDATELGYAIETVSFKHTSDYFHSLDGELYNVGFSREGNKEIDIVIQQQGKDIQYVEAKYRNRSNIKESDGILVYALPNTPGYVVTKDVLDYDLENRGEKSLYRIPAVAFAYLLGKGKR